MKTKSTLMALVAAFSVGLFAVPSAHAEAKTNVPAEKKAVAPAEEKPVKVTVKSGDTLSKIAESHSTTYIRLFNANDFIANPDVIQVGQEIRVPKAEEELADRFTQLQAAPVTPAPVAAPQPAAASTSVVAPSYSTPAPRPVYTASSAGNTYYQGYCTWYAKDRRPDLPNMLGNGGQWVASAAARGIATGSAPRAGAIAETTGHVAYVESVNGDGTIVISEMNGPAGFGVVGTRTVPASQYQYIY